MLFYGVFVLIVHKPQDQAHLSRVNCWLHSFFLSIMCIRYRIWGKISGTCAFAYVCVACVCARACDRQLNMITCSNSCYSLEIRCCTHSLVFFYLSRDKRVFHSDPKKSSNKTVKNDRHNLSQTERSLVHLNRIAFQSQHCIWHRVHRYLKENPNRKCFVGNEQRKMLTVPTSPSLLLFLFSCVF